MQKPEEVFAAILEGVVRAERERIIGIMEAEIAVARECGAHAAVLALYAVERKIQEQAP